MSKELVQVSAEKCIEDLWSYSKEFLPQSCMIHNILRLTLDKRLSEKFSPLFYIYGGVLSPKKDDNLILCVQNNKYLNDRTVTHILPKDLSSDMVSAIESIIDWKIPHSFADLQDPFCTILQDMCKRHNHPISRKKYFANCFQGKEMDFSQCLEEVEIRKLSVDDAQLVNDTWAYKMDGTLDMLQNMIKNLDTVGVYLKSTDELVSWQLTSPLGYTTAMYTLPGHRGKAYASLTLYELAKILKSKQMLANGQSAYSNRSSIAAVHRAGWEDIHVCEWLEYEFDYSNKH